MSNTQYIYILSSPTYKKNVYKITYSLEEDALERIKILVNNTMPKNYYIHLILIVDNSKKILTQIYYHLRDYRYSNYELYQIDVNTLEENLSKYFKKDLKFNKEGINAKNVNEDDDIYFHLSTSEDIYYNYKIIDPTIITIVMLIFIYPFGVFLTWYYKLFTPNIRTIFYSFLFIYIFLLLIFK